MSSNDELVIIGTGEFGKIAHEYFHYDSTYEIAGFAVEEKFKQRDRLFGKPVVPFKNLEDRFQPDRYDAFVALTFTKLNEPRKRLFEAAKSMGYRLATYVSSEAHVWQNVEIGENCFVFEYNNLQPWVEIGDNVILWSCNHIGHRSTIDQHCFLASEVVVSGFVTVGSQCFLGVNATVADRVEIGAECLIGADATILRDTESNAVYSVEHTEPEAYTAREYFDLE